MRAGLLPSDQTLNDGVIRSIRGDSASEPVLRRHCAGPSGDAGVGFGDAPSGVSVSGETAGDAESAGVTDGIAEVSEEAGTDAAGSGVAK